MNKVGAWIAQVFGSRFISDVFNGIDKLSTSEEEKLKIKELINARATDFEAFLQSEITKRHHYDMSSDSWLSKNIRPLTLVFLLLTYTGFSITDGNIGQFVIKEAFIELLGEWGMSVMYFYFGGRSAEKIAEIIRKNKQQK